MSNENTKITVTFFQHGSGVLGRVSNDDGVYYLDRQFNGQTPLPGQVLDCRLVRKLHDKNITFVIPLAESVLSDNALRQKRFLENCRKVGVFVVSKEELRLPVFAKSRFGNEVFLCGNSVGFKDRLADNSVFEKQAVSGYRISLSNGKKLEAYEQHLQVISSWSEPNRYPIKQVVLRSFVELRAGQKTRIMHYGELAKLEVGDEIAYEIPFQRFEQWLTDGLVWLPQKRPFGLKEWKTVPLDPMSEFAWAALVEVLEGKVLDNIVAYYKGNYKKRCKNSKQAALNSCLSPRQVELKAVLETPAGGQIWEASEVKTVSVGNNVIFHVERSDGQTLYVVDNPGVGAIYVFNQHEAAMELASGRLPRSRAMRQKQLRIIHRGRWKQRLAAILKLKSPQAA